MRAHDLPDVVLDGVDGLAAVDDFDALGFGGGERVIGGMDLEVEFDRLIVHARFGMRLGDVAGASAGEAGFGIDVDEDGEVGLESAAGDTVEGEDRVSAESAAGALVDE